MRRAERVGELLQSGVSILDIVEIEATRPGSFDAVDPTLSWGDTPELQRTRP